MHLIIGGAYQGKLSYAMETYQFTPQDVFTCTGTDIDFSRPCINELGAFALACVRENRSPSAYFQEHEPEWAESVLICDDLFCGVVPLSAEDRAWRQETGLLCQYLSKKAQHVTRIFCGLEQKLK